MYNSLFQRFLVYVSKQKFDKFFEKATDKRVK